MSYQDLLPYELFSFQKEAFLTGDMKGVTELGLLAKSRIKNEKRGNWEEAKRELNQTNFPEDLNYFEIKRGEYHSHKKESHKLITYENNLQRILGFELLAKYNYCPECKQVENKILTLINPDESVCHQKLFRWHGKDPKSEKFLQEIAQVFSVLLLLFAL